MGDCGAGCAGLLASGQENASQLFFCGDAFVLEGWCLVGARDLYLAFKLDSVVGKPGLGDLGRVVDVAACMFILCGGDVVHEEVFYFRDRLSRELPWRYAVELAEVSQVA